MNRLLGIFALSLCMAFGVGCASTYYSAWQKLGYEKRDILVSRVKGARDDQQEAKQQFQTTLEQFQALTNFKGGDLEAEYKKLSGQYDSCESRAASVTKKVNSVDKVANDLFAEWETELGQYTDPNLRQQSQQKLTETKSRYAVLIAAMRKSEQKMQPVLKAFKDQVLFLKHNLNAEAIASLHTTAAGIDTDVSQLVKDMEASINEANSFIGQLEKSK